MVDVTAHIYCLFLSMIGNSVHHTRAAVLGSFVKRKRVQRALHVCSKYLLHFFTLIKLAMTSQFY